MGCEALASTSGARCRFVLGPAEASKNYWILSRKGRDRDKPTEIIGVSVIWGIAFELRLLPAFSIANRLVVELGWHWALRTQSHSSSIPRMGLGIGASTRTGGSRTDICTDAASTRHNRLSRAHVYKGAAQSRAPHRRERPARPLLIRACRCPAISSHGNVYAAWLGLRQPALQVNAGMFSYLRFQIGDLNAGLSWQLPMACQVNLHSLGPNRRLQPLLQKLDAAQAAAVRSTWISAAAQGHWGGSAVALPEVGGLACDRR